jgi:hypothetical protein
LKRHGNESDAILTSNLLPTDKEFDYSTAEYKDFLLVRAKLLESYIEKLCEGQV